MIRKSIFVTLLTLLLLIPISAGLYDTEQVNTTKPPTTQTTATAYINITVQQAFDTYLSSLDAGIQIPIDIRRQDEWDEERIETFGDVQQPVHWPDLQLGVGLQDFLTQYADKEVIVYCRTAGRSWAAVQLLVSHGFQGTLYHMLGGIVAWKNARYPTAISVHLAHGMLTTTSDGIQTPIDIRTKQEWRKGRIDTPAPENPVHYPDLHLGVGINDFLTTYPNNEVVLYCDTDARSSQAVDLLIQKIKAGDYEGYVHNMIGGINAWSNAGFPTPLSVSQHRFASTNHPLLLRILHYWMSGSILLRTMLKTDV